MLKRKLDLKITINKNNLQFSTSLPKKSLSKKTIEGIMKTKRLRVFLTREVKLKK